VLTQDLHYGFRLLARDRGVTAVAVLTLALGIGVNTAVFSVVNSMLLRPLPVPDPGNIVVLGQQLQDSTFNSTFSFRDYVDYRDQADTLSALSGYELTLAGLSTGDKVERSVVTYVTGNYFSALGVKPAVGRLILPSEGQSPGADPVIVLGYSYWKRRFGGSLEVIGKSVRVNGHAVTVVGVAAKSFHGVYALVESDAYLPFSLAVTHKDSSLLWTARNERALSLVGRLKPGISITQGQASLNLVANRLARQYPDTNKGIMVRLFPERLARPEPDPSGSLSVVAMLFLILAGLVLLVACVNVTNIVLVRASARQHEMALRTAVGATRGRLIQQMLAESALLALLGGIAGVAVGALGSKLLASVRLHIDVPIRLDFSIDWQVFAYGFATAVFTAIVVGMVPAWRASRTGTNVILLEGGRTLSPTRSRQRLRNLLVLVQMAGSLTLLIVGGLFVRSLGKAQHMNLGFDPERVLNLSMDVREAGYNEARGREFYRQLLIRTRALPAVQSASLAFSVPFGYYRQNSKVYVESRPLAPGEQAPEFSYNVVSPGYFETLGIPILRGRAFTDGDNEAAPRVGIVNETMARQFWPEQDPIGKRFRVGSPSGPFISVIGVIRDGKYLAPTEGTHPYFFVPLEQQYIPVQTLQVRTTVAPETLVDTALKQITALEPNLPVFDLQTMPRALEGINGFFLFRMGAILAGTLGGLGLILAVVGIYGVAAYAASQRSHEMGIRLALGAQPRDLQQLVLKQGLRLVGLGVLAGLLAAVAITRLMSSMLVGVGVVDPATFGFVIPLAMAVGLLACYIPARRALRVDPALLLRNP
jgi:putative ABC transport system permease protein